MPSSQRKAKPGYHLGRSTMRENNNNNNHNYHHHHRNITQPAEFHYCSIHQLHHCIARTTTTTSRVNNGHRSARPSQTAPVHGECAWLFFSPRNAVQHRNLDYADPPGPPFPSLPPAHSSNDNRSDTSSSSSGTHTLVNNSNTNSNTSRHSSPSSPSSSSSSAFTSLPFPAPPRTEKYEFAVDGDGDVIMTDAPSVTENKEKEDNKTNVTVRIPIRRRVSLQDILHSFPPPNPHAESAAWDVSWDEAFHPRFPGVAMLEYTDTFGRRGAQPTASTVEQLRRYLAVLEREEAREEVEGYCDPLMREVREVRNSNFLLTLPPLFNQIFGKGCVVLRDRETSRALLSSPPLPPSLFPPVIYLLVRKVPRLTQEPQPRSGPAGRKASSPSTRPSGGG